MKAHIKENNTYSLLVPHHQVQAAPHSLHCHALDHVQLHASARTHPVAINLHSSIHHVLDSQMSTRPFRSPSAADRRDSPVRTSPSPAHSRPASPIKFGDPHAAPSPRPSLPAPPAVPTHRASDPSRLRHSVYSRRTPVLCSSVHRFSRPPRVRFWQPRLRLALYSHEHRKHPRQCVSRLIHHFFSFSLIYRRPLPRVRQLLRSHKATTRLFALRPRRHILMALSASSRSIVHPNVLPPTTSILS